MHFYALIIRGFIFGHITTREREDSITDLKEISRKTFRYHNDNSSMEKEKQQGIFRNSFFWRFTFTSVKKINS